MDSHFKILNIYCNSNFFNQSIQMVKIPQTINEINEVHKPTVFSLRVLVISIASGIFVHIKMNSLGIFNTSRRSYSVACMTNFLLFMICYAGCSLVAQMLYLFGTYLWLCLCFFMERNNKDKND